MSTLSLTPSQIKQKWDDNRDTAAREGTWMHFTFECWLNRTIVEEDTKEMQLFRQYMGTLSGLTAHRTEWTIYADDECLAGSIDFTATDRAGNLVLFDWKRSKAWRQCFYNTSIAVRRRGRGRTKSARVRFEA